MTLRSSSARFEVVQRESVPMSSRPPVEIESLRTADALLDELAALAARGGAADEFFGRWLEGIGFATDASGATLWIGEGGSSIDLQVVSRWGAAPPTTLADPVATRSSPVVLADDPLAERETAPRHRTVGDRVESALPIRDTDRIWGWIGIAVETSVARRAAKTLEHLMAAFVEIAEEYLARYRALRIADRERRHRQRFELALALQRCEGTEEVAAEGTAAGRIVAGVDRVALVRSRRRPRVLAVGGQTRIDRRSTALRALVAAVRELQRAGKPLLIVDAGRDERPFDPRIGRYLNEVKAIGWAAIPLCSDDRSPTSSVDHWLIFETFSPIPDRIELLEAIGAVAPQVESALRRSASLDRIPLRHLQGAMASAFGIRRFGRTALLIAALALAAAGVAWGSLTQVERRLTVTGELRPEIRRRIFAPADAKVARVMVAEGTSVRAGTVLLELDDPDLRDEFERLTGERRSSQLRLESLRIELNRLAANGADREVRLQAERTSAEMKLIEQGIANTDRMIERIEARRAELQVLSPIDGRIVTWRVGDLLGDRPVRRGETLMEIVQDDGPWELILTIPDERMEAGIATGSFGEIPVEFAIRTETERRHQAIVRHVDPSTTADASTGAGVRVACAVRSEADESFRNGATVQASLRLGNESVIEMLTRDTRETWMRYWFR